VKSLFNAETGANFDLDAELDIEVDGDWQIGVVVGPSGSGKTSVGRLFFGEEAFFEPSWPADEPIIDAIGPEASFDAVTAALASVGLGDVPAWLRPFHALSMGEQFRSTLARLVVEAPQRAVVDEFTSVVDRQIARIGALAFAKAWRRTAGKVVLLTPHYDVLDWLEPDWIFDTGRKEFSRRRLRRPQFDLDIVKTDWCYWPQFAPHHYLKIAKMPAASCYVGTVDGELVAHLAVGSKNKGKHVEARACRLVVMPEWQGAGVGVRFLNWICENQLLGGDGARLPYPATTCFHTSHPGLCAVLRRQPAWTQISAKLHGSHKGNSAKSIAKSGRANIRAAKAARLAGKQATTKSAMVIQSGFGGHFRAAQGFRYIGNSENN
jgi:energy-coupling factor transporter ATP-binding protein EcfA2